jgi:hypothetical protein
MQFYFFSFTKKQGLGEVGFRTDEVLTPVVGDDVSGGFLPACSSR